MDADKLCQIAIIQDLGRLGIPVVAVAGSPSAFGLRSRHVSRKIIAPMPSHDDAYAGFLLSSAPRGVLFYSNDANAEMVARQSRALSDGGFSFLVSSPATLQSVIHKDRLYVTAAECGVKVPRSLLVSPAEAGAAAASIGFPCILKSTNLAGGVYEPVPGPHALDAALRRMLAKLSDAEWQHRHAGLMVQEWIPQDHTTLWNFNALAEDGEIISYSMGVRIRSDVRRDGSIGSMLLHGVTNYNSDIFEANRKLLRHIRYTGIMETEWSQSLTGSQHLYLYDFNPRPSGNFRWTLKSGVPMALQYYQRSLALAVTGDRAMRTGVSYFKLLTRNNDFIWSLKNPRLSARGRARILAEDFCALLRPGQHAIDILDFGDLGPTTGACKDLLSFCWRELVRQTSREGRHESGANARKVKA